MNILKKISLLLFILICSINAQTITPMKKISVKGGVTDLLIKNNKLYVATKEGSIEIFDEKSHKLLETIQYGKIKDFVGDEINSKIYSIDVLDNKILVVSQGEKGGRNIDIFSNGIKTNIIKDTQKLFISKARFFDQDKIIFSLLSNQLYLYDFKS